MNFYTADHHFGHKNIIKHAQRPFKDIREHDDTIIKKYKERVTNEDIVFFIGDFAMASGSHNTSYYEAILNKLPGTKHLILGNHDELKPFTYVKIGFTSVHTSLEYNGFILNHDPAVSIILPNRTWLCGHVHTLFKQCKNVINVGVDQWDFYPVSEKEINEVLRT